MSDKQPVDRPDQDGAPDRKGGIALGRLVPRRRGENSQVQRARPRPAIATEFQPDVVEVEDKSPRRFAQWVLYSLLSMMGVGVLWAALAHVDRVVTAPGQINTDLPKVVLQPLETSIIREVNVGPGDIVKAGDTLVTLDPTFAGADLADLTARQRSFSAEIARLEAELEDRLYVTSATPSPDELLQLTLFERRRGAHVAQLENLRQEVRRQESLLATSSSDVVNLTKQLDIATQVEEMRRELSNKEVGSRLTLLLSQNDRLSIASSLERARNSMAEAESGIASVQARREAYLQQWRQQVATELVDARRKLNEVTEQIRKAELRSDRVNLTAPIEGIVLEMSDFSVGSVVDNGDILVTLVPANSPLEVEAKVPVTDVGFVVPGQPVRIKLSAYPFQKHGTADGILRWVSEDTFADRQRPEIRYYKAKVEITKTDLRNLPDNFRLIPGMTVTAEIKVGDRSVLSYFLYPIFGTLDEAIRDPRL